MQKNVAISTANPAGSAALILAEQIIGGVPAEPRLRWNPASLMLSVVNAIPAPVVAFLSGSVLAVFASTGAETFTASNNSDGLMARFKALPGNTKSRPLDLASLSGEYTVTPASSAVNSTTFDSTLMDAILLPKVPSYTIQSLISSILGYTEDPATNIPTIVSLDQATGIVRVWDQNAVFYNPLTSADGIPSLRSDFALGLLLCAFDLTDPPVDNTGSPFVQAPFWG